jgi:hypothetical protein
MKDLSFLVGDGERPLQVFGILLAVGPAEDLLELAERVKSDDRAVAERSASGLYDAGAPELVGVVAGETYKVAGFKKKELFIGRKRIGYALELVRFNLERRFFCAQFFGGAGFYNNFLRHFAVGGGGSLLGAGGGRQQKNSRYYFYHS